jgi:hypothetical protein
MHFPHIIIKTCENFKDITMFPFLEKSCKQITITYDCIPIKYEEKNYFISLAFPYKYDQIHLQKTSVDCDDPTIIYEIHLIHQSDELNLSIFKCDTYIGKFYTLDDLKYKIPKNNFEEFKFLNSHEDGLVNINHIDYTFKNLYHDLLPPFAYLICQSEVVYNSSILINISNKSIYGIKDKFSNVNIVIPSIAIKRLLEGISSNFEYSNLYCDYELYNTTLNNGIKIISSQYDNIIQNDAILDIQNLKIINGKIKYNRIDEWVPIEVYMWYEWLPNVLMEINTYYKGVYSKKNIQFIDYKQKLKIPISAPEENTKIKRLTFRLMEYFAEKNIILFNQSIDEAIMKPYNTREIYLDINEELLNLKCDDVTHFPIQLAIF